MLSLRPGGLLLAMAQRQTAQGAAGCWQAPLGCRWVERGGITGVFLCQAGALLALGGDPEPGSEQFLSHFETLGWKSAL